jgi:uncharacterized protein YjiS (DUF1127 family)
MPENAPPAVPPKHLGAVMISTSPVAPRACCLAQRNRTLLGVAPVVFAARTLGRICLRLWRALQDWRARGRDRFYFGALNEYEIDWLAKDVGLNRSELLGENRNPTPQNLLPPLQAARGGSRPASRVRLIRSMDA